MCVCRSRALSQIITTKLCVGVLVTQLCPTLYNSMNYSPPGFPVHGILQARILEWVAISSSRGSSWPRDRTCVSCVSCIVGGFFIHCAMIPLSQIYQRSFRKHTHISHFCAFSGFACIWWKEQLKQLIILDQTSYTTISLQQEDLE